MMTIARPTEPGEWRWGVLWLCLVVGGALNALVPCFGTAREQRLFTEALTVLVAIRMAVAWFRREKGYTWAIYAAMALCQTGLFWLVYALVTYSPREWVTYSIENVAGLLNWIFG